MNRIPNWLKITGALLGMAIAIQTFSHLLASPEQKAIRRCVSELNDAAQGGLSGAQLERQCALMLQRGELKL